MQEKLNGLYDKTLEQLKKDTAEIIAAGGGEQ